MPYTTDAALDFWYEFDQAFLFAATPEVNALYGAIYGPSFAIDALVDVVRDQASNLPAIIGDRAPSFRRLAEIQLEIMTRHFPDSKDLQRAFEDFGHGVLFDSKTVPTSGQLRRPVGRIIHMMDGTPDDCVGYHRWHAFIRAAVAAGANANAWLVINRYVVLAWAIYSELSPREDAPSNPPLTAERLESLRKGWLSADEQTLNQVFLNYQGKFPDDYGNRRAGKIDEVRYSLIQRVLANASAGSNPQHTGGRRFWELPVAQFLQIQVYGQRLLAPKGQGRGAASPLVLALRGTLPGFPRMPLHRPPLEPAQILYIEEWIDNLELA